MISSQLNTAKVIESDAVSWRSPNRLVLYGVVAILLIVAPHVMPDNYWLRIYSMTGLWIMLALGLNVVAGFAGLLDLAYVAFFGIGGYTFALLSSGQFDIHWPFLLVLPLAAIALTTDTSVLTSIGNDYHFDDIFLKQIRALGKKGDIAWGLSTSGNSPNVVKAVKAAQKIGMSTIGMTGRGGELGKCAEIVFAVDSDTTARVQETHITLGHILCELVERKLYPEEFSN